MNDNDIDPVTVTNWMIAAACLAAVIGLLEIYGAIAELVVLRKNDRLEKEFVQNTPPNWYRVLIWGTKGLTNVIVRGNTIQNGYSVTNDAGERWTWEPLATNNIIRK